MENVTKQVSYTDEIKLYINKYKKYLIWILLSFILTTIVEAISRGGLEESIKFLNERTMRFIINYMMILLVTSPSIIGNRFYLIFSIIAEILIILSIISYAMFNFRGTPLTYSDLYSIQDGIAIAGKYIDIESIISICIALAIIILLNISISKYYKYTKLRLGKLGLMIIIALFIVLGFSIKYSLQKGILIPNQWDIKLSYDDNGFIYSLYNSYQSYKKKPPQKYSKSNIEKIKSTMEKKYVLGNEELNPNIIFYQIESVMDPFDLKGIIFSEDPIPNIRKLMEKYSSGLLDVPTIGGGTARTEFEVMTGMSMDYFSQGEIPHNSVLKKKPIESLAYVLDKAMYDKTFIHNFQGSFYGRNEVYKNLGFERYIPIEYMYDIKVPYIYPSDELILQNVKEVIENSKKRDFIFAMGVQTHGSYSFDYINPDSEINVSGGIEKRERNQIQDYIDDLVQVDRAVGSLVEYVEGLEEPTVLVVYSDHLPGLENIYNNFSTNEKYLTPYFICDNFGLEKEDMDIEAYQLSTRLLNIIEKQGGVMNIYHNSYMNSISYQNNLELIQYDILNGKNYLIDKSLYYKKSDIKMGLKEIKIDKVINESGNLIIKGKGFNIYSIINVDGKQIETEYIDYNTLKSTYKIDKAAKITVSQISRYSKSIGYTNEYKVN